MNTNIEIYIDKLVLHGYDQKTGRSIGAALEQQLTKLLLEQGLPPAAMRSASIRNLDAGQISTHARPSELGNNIAGNIYQSLSQ